MTRRAIAVGLGALVISTSALAFALTTDAHAATGWQDKPPAPHEGWNRATTKEFSCPSAAMNADTRPMNRTTNAGGSTKVNARTSAASASAASDASMNRSARPADLAADGLPNACPGDLTVAAGCTVTHPVVQPSGTRATFTVAGECVVSLVSYERHGTGLGGQTLFDATTKEFSCSPSASTQGPSKNPSSAPKQHSTSSTGPTCAHELTVTVPDCPWQVDLVLGPPRNPPTGYGKNVLAYRYGGEGKCETPSTTTPSPSSTTTTVPTTTTSEAGSPTSTSSSTTVSLLPASTPTAGTGTPSTPTEELPQSGAALWLGGLLGVALVGAGYWVERRGRRRRAG